MFEATMTTDTTNAYLRNKVLSASPAELRLMLIEGAIRFCRVGGEGLVAKNYEQSYTGLLNAKNILMELITSLRDEVDPDLCAKLRGLYMYMYRRLVDANLEKSPAAVNEVVGLLEFERETWVMLMERLAKEGAGTPPPPVARPTPASVTSARPAPGGMPAAPRSGATGGHERAPISVEA